MDIKKAISCGPCYQMCLEIIDREKFLRIVNLPNNELMKEAVKIYNSSEYIQKRHKENIPLPVFGLGDWKHEYWYDSKFSEKYIEGREEG